MVDVERTRLTDVLEELSRAVAADAGAVLYLDDGNGMFHFAAATREGGPGNGLLDRLRGKGDGNGRTMTIGLPQAGGFVVVGRRSGTDFTQQDRTVARLYARQLTDQAATAGSQIRQSGWMRQLEAIQRIAARLTRLASVEEVGATICSETAEVIEHDEAHVLVVDERGQLERVAASWAGQVDVPPLPAHGHAGEAVARAVRGGVPVIAPAVDDLGPQRPGTYSMLLVPLHYESRVSGLICLLAQGTQRFDDDDLRLLRILSDQAAVAMENSRLLDGRDELVQELASLLEISEAAGAAEDEAKLSGLLATRLRAATRTDAAIVSLWDDGSTELNVVSRIGLGGAATIDVADSPVRRAVLRDGRSYVIQAEWSDTAVDAAQLRQIGARTLIVLPLNAGGRTIGMVELLAMRQPRHLSESEMHACEAMAGLAAAGLERVRVAEQLRNAADMDTVTGVHNHRYLQERLRQEVARSARSHSPLAVLMLDLDKFKPINDRFGHADGDRVLHNIAATIKMHVRTSDVVARYGGDEFVVLMPDTTDDRAEHVARRVVEGILRDRHELSDGSKVSVGVSAGLSVYPTDGRTPAQLLSAADAAMYSAKRTGGRQVERSASPVVIEVVGAPAPALG